MRAARNLFCVYFSWSGLRTPAKTHLMGQARLLDPMHACTCMRNDSAGDGSPDRAKKFKIYIYRPRSNEYSLKKLIWSGLAILN